MGNLRNFFGISLGLLLLINTVIVNGDEQINCFSCNSRVDFNCRKNPLKLIQCSSGCYSKILKNGDFERGCISSLSDDLQTSCQSDSSDDCVSCYENSCNSIEIRPADIGIWQKLPLNCYTCLGGNCESDLVKLTKCTNESQAEDCWTVFSANDEILGRGCRDTILEQFEEHCTNNQDKCFQCKSNGCNIAKSPSEFKSCWSCDSSNDKNCIFNPSMTEKKLCHNGCMVALYPWNTDINPSYHTVRTCLDDKDLDDQQLCLSGNDKNCAACIDDSCNSNDVIDKRFECFTCPDGDCQDIKIEKCTTYKENEQCFTHFNDNTDIDILGCASVYTNEEINNMIKEKNLLVCDGENCNSFENILTPNDCISCTSVQNGYCATNPVAVVNKLNCGLIPYTQCYTKITNGTTERGCLSDLVQDEFWNCFTGNSSDCNICTGNRCNEAVFPENRLRCHQCNSIENNNCETSPASSNVCPIYDSERETCVTVLTDGITYRGCGTSLACKSNDPRECNICSGNNCNVINLKHIADGDYGLWQQLPINCYTCEGEECLTSNGTLRKCENNNFQDCLTIFNDKQQVVRRGCSDLVELEYETFCAQNPTNCLNCKSTACNFRNSLEEYTECVYCNSIKDPNCLSDPESIKDVRHCAGGCMSAWYPTLDSLNSAVGFIRTCLDDKDEDDRTICQSGADDNCRTCNGAKCNKDLWQIENLECYHCNGENCETPLSKNCSTFIENNKCFILFDEEKSAIQMGCQSALNQQQITDNIRKLWFCDGHNCNTYENMPRETLCRQCSSENDEICTTDPLNIPGRVRCSDRPYTECFTLINENGHTERGCVANLDDSLFNDCLSGNSSTCKACSEDYCNENIYPPNRQQCYRCNSKDSTKCEANAIDSIICPIYNPDETCVIKLIDNVTYRDCSSQLTCNGTNPCIECKDKNCNNYNLAQDAIDEPGKWQQFPLNCYTCEGDDCINNLVVLRKCERDLNEVCMTIFNDTNSVVSRGCSESVLEKHETYCNNNSDHCFKCLSNGCNVAESIDDYIDCWKCDSSKNQNCPLNPENLIFTRKCYKNCMVAMHKRPLSSTNYDLIRSCADDKDVDDQDLCNDGLCNKCNKTLCNEFDVIEKRLTCNICNDNCESLKSAICSTYSTNDQCYLLFDNYTENIIGAGCRSEFDDPKVVELIKSRHLFLCGGNDCNNFENLPPPTKCFECSSKTDANCIAIDNQRKVNCPNLPFTQCYYRLTDEGYMERGCLNNLEDNDFIDCLNETENCHICNEDDCNNKLYPEEQIQCHQCNSIDSPENCEKNPIASDYCQQYTEPQQCVTKLDNGITYRGCSLQYPCKSNGKNCLNCEGENCNRVNLKRKDLDPGLWQLLPLKCYTCDGDECNNSLGILQKCENNDQQFCMTVFKDGVVIKRGCSDAIEAIESDYCDGQPEKCVNCLSSGCNIANATTEYKNCLYCDSSKNASCLHPDKKTNTRLCLGSCMTALYPRNNDANPSYNLIRTCLDDKDVDDQWSCSGGNDEKCKSCENENCNTADLPEKRLKCWTCVGASCDQPISEECVTYNDNDQCFMLFDNTGSVSQMGCRSIYSQSEINSNIRKLFLCNGDNCNTYDNLPQGIFCAQCSSQTDENCVTKPSEIEVLTRCSDLPHTDCFTMVNSAGHTTRGCVSSLFLSEFNDCISGNSKTCKTCNDSYCNQELYPLDRRSCYRCNSDTDPNCEGNPDNSSLCLIYKPDEICVTSLNNGTTKRGCGHELSCNTTDRANCRTCANDNCNTIDLEDANIGVPGKWQQLPINCFNCTGVDCTNGMEKLIKCENNDLQNCKTVFDSNGKVVARGCSDFIDKLYDDHCDQYPENCPACKSTGCNVAKTLDDFVDCIVCDSDKKSECVFDPASIKKRRSCYKKCMVALSPKESDPNPSFDLIRGCLDDKDVEDRESCEQNDDIHCRSCESGNCNNYIIPEKRLSCNVCEDEKCENLLPVTCSTYRPEDRCYILFDHTNDIHKMGCLSEYSTNEIETNFQELLICDGDNCNTFSLIKNPNNCMVCDSKANELCATSPQDIVNIEQCQKLAHTECFVQITEDGHTQRGCASNLDYQTFSSCSDDNNKKCTLCDNNKCNGGVYPEDRQSCYRCSSHNDEFCEWSPNSISLCPIYNETDTCVVAITEEQTVRACGTELICDTTDRKNCRICKGDNCNTVNLAATNVGDPGLWTDLPLKCFKCSGDECSDISSNSYGQCENNNLQNCMTVFNANGAVIRRGCSDEVEAELESHCEEHPELCFTCKSNICNVAESLDNYIDCIFCDSNNNPLCTINSKSINRNRKCYKSCMVALYPRSSSDHSSLELVRSCADDKDIDDRELCEQGKAEYCQTCNSRKCNIDILPDSNRLSCYHCTDESCEDPQIHICPSYNANDKCFILFDTMNTVAQMGCISIFDSDELESLIKGKQLKTCDSESCNGFESLPQEQSCTKCNSATNSNCALMPFAVLTSENCALLPYTECFTRIDDDGVTHRGCVNGLDEDTFVNCLNGNNTLCQTCVGEKCNDEVYPINRRKCHICDSTTDSNCHASPKSLSICPVYNEDDECVVTLKNDITYRGCKSEVTCNENDSKNCRVCSTDGCNTFNLIRNADGDPGLWQDLPLSCYDCLDGNCDKPEIRTVCENNNLQTCKTIFNGAGKVKARGCSDDIDPIYDSECDANPSNCFNCKSNDCNNATSIDNFVDCYFCDSANNPNCVQNPQSISRTRKCQIGCMAAMYPSNAGSFPSYELIRSCWDDKNAAERNQCRNGEDSNCKACFSDKCNNFELPENRLSCYQCSDDSCENPTIQTCSTYRDNDQCFILFDDMTSVTQMGCKSIFNDEDIDDLIASKKLHLCDENNCNSYENLPKVYSCQLCSSRTNSACANNPSSTASTRCAKQPHTSCYTRILSDKSTERGCLSSLEGDEFLNCYHNKNGTNCAKCDGDVCNNEIYPAERLACHQCNSNDNSNCASSNPESLLVCSEYDKNDVCVSELRDGITYRGCGTEMSCDPTSETCKICETTGCNTIEFEGGSNPGDDDDDNYGKWQDLPLSCYHCIGDECSLLGTTKTCENNNEQDCLTVFDANGLVVRRGCEDEVIKSDYGTWCTENPEKCFKCKSNKCNVASFETDFVDCLYCDSNKDVNCVLQPNATSIKTRKCQGSCMVSLYQSQMDDPIYDLIRTCTNDKEEIDANACKAGSDGNCKACEGKNCNNYSVPDNRLSCYQCSGSDCDVPLNHICPLYDENDQCYILIDDSQSVIGMGCRSEIASDSIDELLKQKKIYLCDGDDCNNYDDIPQSQYCYLCSSSSDTECATNPESVISATLCNQIPYTGCYTRIISGGHTERGCISSLEDEDFLECYKNENSNRTNCVSCNGDGCNNKTVPEDRLQCYHCNSKDDPECENTVLNIKACPIYQLEERCVVALNGDVIHRGCSSDIKCESTGRKKCRICKTSGCNSFNLNGEEEYDPNHGLWQDLPLKCHNCTGEACLNSLGPAQICVNNNEQDCMTVFNTNGDVARRGCYDEVDEEYYSHCDENPELCFTCKSNECNAVWNLSEYIRCRYCDTRTDPNCIYELDNPAQNKTRSCHNGCMIALFPSHDGNDSANELIRTCLDDKETVVQHTCAENATCSSCTTNDCNNYSFPDKWFKCHVCDGENCQNSTSRKCPLYKENDSCFAIYNEGDVYELGCSSSLNDDVILEMIKANRYFNCREDNCNELSKLPKAQNCAQCSSTVNSDCASYPDLVSSKENCGNPPNTQCYTNITSDGSTNRGCVSSLNSNDMANCIMGSSTCTVCYGENCNKDVFPADRRSCYICTSKDDKSCTSNPQANQICPIYDAQNTCVTKFTDGVTERGCSSQLTCDQSNQKKCRICKNDGCNTIDLLKENGVGANAANFLLIVLLAIVSVITLSS